MRQSIGQMLVSHVKKILFVHVSRTGGTSIRNLLSRSVSDATEIAGFHSVASEAEEILGKDFDDYFKFAFVRNPWERMVSWYSMIMGTEGDENKAMTFDEFLETWIPSEGALELPTQLDCITDSAGKIIVNEVGRFESFGSDLARILSRLNISADADLAKINGSKHNHYSSYYSEDSIRRVGEVYKQDVDYFGYQFEQQANE